MNKLSILIPVYNAGKTIGQLCKTLIDLYSNRFGLEIVLVNDGSKDNSDEICRKLYSAHKDIVTYIKLSKNFGEHNALMAGLNHVTGDYCVMMDDDLQNPPEEVFKLIDEIQKGYDVVYTVYPSKKDNLFRNLGSRFNDKVANIILQKPAGLYLSSFKIINRFLVNEIVKHTGTDPYIDGIILRTTDNIGKVQVEHRRREYDKSNYTFVKLINLWGSMVVSFSMLPLRIIGITGFILILIGIFYGLYKAYDDFHTIGKLTEFETLMSANMVFRGVVLFAIGIVGEYIGRIFLSLTKDPQFVIREILFPKRGISNVEHIKDFKVTDGKK